MSKKNANWWALSWCSLILLCGSLTSCDRGASNQIGVARKFVDAVTRNEVAKRDSMIATPKFKEYFTNSYVASDMISWFKTFYNYRDGHFSGEASADVDRNLTTELEGALLDTNHIEESGVVKVKSPLPGEDAAYFWMVRQAGKPWRVAIVTKGDAAVDFR